MPKAPGAVLDIWLAPEALASGLVSSRASREPVPPNSYRAAKKASEQGVPRARRPRGTGRWGVLRTRGVASWAPRVRGGSVWTWVYWLKFDTF